jgi:hypothetical protein
MAKKSLEERIQRLEDIHEIQNLMSRYEYLHTAGLQDETADLFAKKTPGVRAEIANWGVYEGIEGIRRLYPGFHKYLEGNPAGQMFMHALTTSVIEVAGDGKTAKGVWISPGHETIRDPEGKPQAMWTWIKYGNDFVKEDSKWKIWHLHVYGIFHTPYEKSWVEVSGEIPFEISVPVPDELKPDRPTTHPLWWYRPTVAPENVPAPPEPYETWDESTTYVK